jgi:NitT/TauT family transport system permease protein
MATAVPRSMVARLAQPAVWVSVAIGLAFLAAWQWLPGFLGVPEFVIPPASAVGQELLRMLAQEDLVYHTEITAASVVMGFAFGAALGAAIGYALAISPTAEFALSPYIPGTPDRAQGRLRAAVRHVVRL